MIQHAWLPLKFSRQITPVAVMATDKKMERFPLIAEGEREKTPDTTSKEQQLKKSLGCFSVFVYVASTMIGTGIYVSPALVARYTSNMGTSLIIWTVSGIACLLGALCLCEMAVSLRKTGNRYIYIKEAYGDLPGFCTIWAQTLIISPAAIAVVAVTMSEHIVGLFVEISSEKGQWIIKALAIVFALMSFLINCTSIDYAAKAQSVFGAMQVLSMIFFISIGIWKVSDGNMQNYKLVFTNSGNRSVDFNSLNLAVVSALWSYDGWGGTVSLNEELLDMNRDLRLGIITGIPFVIVCFLLLNLAFMSTLTHKEIGRSLTVATTFIERSIGGEFTLIVPVIVAFSCFGSLNSMYMSGSRSVLSAAREGHLPLPFSYIHHKRCTPVVALLLLFALSIMWTLTLGSRMMSLVSYYSIAIWMFYCLALFGVIVLRIRRPDIERPYKVWLIYPILTSILSAYFAIAPLFKRPIQFVICCLCILSAIPVHYLVVHCIPESVKKRKEEVYLWILEYFPVAKCVVETASDVTLSDF